MIKKLTKQDIINWATERSWKLDKWGHLQKQVGDKKYRFKLSSTAMRNEVKVNYDFGGSDWVRLLSGYYKDLSINSDGKLVGLK